jgi:hypothetical protein
LGGRHAMQLRRFQSVKDTGIVWVGHYNRRICFAAQIKPILVRHSIGLRLQMTEDVRPPSSKEPGQGIE